MPCAGTLGDGPERVSGLMVMFRAEAAIGMFWRNYHSNRGVVTYQGKAAEIPIKPCCNVQENKGKKIVETSNSSLATLRNVACVMQ